MKNRSEHPGTVFGGSCWRCGLSSGTKCPPGYWMTAAECEAWNGATQAERREMEKRLLIHETAGEAPGPTSQAQGKPMTDWNAINAATIADLRARAEKEEAEQEIMAKALADLNDGCVAYEKQIERLRASPVVMRRLLARAADELGSIPGGGTYPAVRQLLEDIDAFLETVPASAFKPSDFYSPDHGCIACAVGMRGTNGCMEQHDDWKDRVVRCPDCGLVGCAGDCRARCGIASGLHADDERCTFQKNHDGACSHGIPRDA